jgi:hypothetical protein
LTSVVTPPDWQVTVALATPLAWKTRNAAACTPSCVTRPLIVAVFWPAKAGLAWVGAPVGPVPWQALVMTAARMTAEASARGKRGMEAP